MVHVFLDGLARPLLVVHALAAFAALGAATHLVIAAVAAARGRPHGRLLGRYAQVVGATFGAAFILGLLLYPSYRWHVRGLVLDRHAPWASNLFDVKETLAGLGVPLALGVFFVGRRLDDPALRLPFAWLCALLWALLVAAAIAGLVVTSVRGVG